jgi:cyclin-dependent kinase-like
MTQEQQERF